MADEDMSKADASAEKAYAAAAEAVPVKAEPENAAIAELAAAADPAPAETPPPAPVEFPAKAKRAKAAKPVAAAPKIEPVVIEAAPEPDLPKTRAPAKKPAAQSRAKSVRRAAAAKAAPKLKPAVAKAAPKKMPAKIAKAPVKSLTPKPSIKPVAAAKIPAAPLPKEKIMEKTTEFTEGLKKAATDAQAKAKKAFEKSSAMFGDYAEFAKGNVEAVVESGKIFATGLQSFGSSMVAEGKTAIETTTADVKALTAVKSPSEFFKLNSEIVKRNFDNAVALTSKNGETMMKLATDSFAPIQGRFTLAMEKVKKAA